MIIVSIAVISSRLGNILPIIRNLEGQSRPPDKVLFYFSSEPWHLDAGVSGLVMTRTCLDVQAICVPNLGSCRKYIFSSLRYRMSNHSLLLLDDDLIFDRCLIETLADHQNIFRRVVAARGWKDFDLLRDEKGQEYFSRSPETTVIGSKIIQPTEVAVTSSGWATMFYPADVDCRMFDRCLQQQVNLGYSDEIFLSAMLPEGKYVIPMPSGFRTKLPSEASLKHAPETRYAKALQARLLKCHREIKMVS